MLIVYIYCGKKGVRIITTRNEPLLFIQGPPVFIRVSVLDDESTSVFVLHGDDEEWGQEDVQESAVTSNPSVFRRLITLSKPFSRQIYSPLTFQMGDQTYEGSIIKLEDNVVQVVNKEKEEVALEISKIEEIFWRGKPFEE